MMTNRASSRFSGIANARSFRRQVLCSILVFWAAYFALATLRAWLLDFDDQFDTAIRRLNLVVIGVGLTALIARLLRMLDGRPIVLIVIVGAIASLAATSLFAAINWLLFYRLFPSADQIAAAETWGDRSVLIYATVETGYNLYYFFLGWVLSYAALLALAQGRFEHSRAMNAMRAAHDAELRALRYQLNPHFLFNCLNLLSSLVAEDRKDEADRVILDFAELLRLMLAERATETIRLCEELHWQALYLSLEKRRHEDRLDVQMDCPPELDDVHVPILISQPLVENAVKHGLAHSRGMMRLRIGAAREQDTLVITVANEGRISAQEGEGHGIGLANIEERLQLIYDANAWLESGPTRHGYEARLHLPIQREKVRAHREAATWE